MEPSPAFRCDQCTYTTNKRYNLDRHSKTHNGEQPSTSGLPCPTCYKKFATTKTLKRHEHVCKHIEFPNQCPDCKQVLGSYAALYKHRKACPISLSAPGSTVNIETQNNTNIQTQNNTTINNINQTVNLLVFPQNGEDFDFITKHISPQEMLELIQNKKPAAAFGRFVGAVMTNPANQIIYKTNPNVNYSKVHTGDGNWEYALDTDVFPEVTHHMTTAALSRLEEDKKVFKSMSTSFKQHVQEINEDDDSQAFHEALARMKLIIINICQRFPQLNPNT